MRVLWARPLNGPNMYHERPVLEAGMELEPEEHCTTSGACGFISRLFDLLPGLAEHHCRVARPGGFHEEAVMGTPLPHVVQHVMVELQALAGIHVEFGATVRRGADWRIAVSSNSTWAAECALRCSVRLVKSLFQGAPIALEPLVARVRRAAARHTLDLNTRILLAAAQRRDIPCLCLGKGGQIIQLGYGVRQHRLVGTITDATSFVGTWLACHPELACIALARAGLPVSPVAATSNQAEAFRVACQIGYPVVVRWRNPEGETLGLVARSEEELREALAIAPRGNGPFLLSKHLAGRHYRLLVVGEEVVAAYERVPAHVVGDGVHTVRQLVTQANQDARRWPNLSRVIDPLTIDSVARAVLARQSINPDDIAPPGRPVFLRDAGELAGGAVTVDMTDVVHPVNARIAVRAASAVGLSVAGVDLVARHISLPIEGTGGAITGITAEPDLRSHHYPWRGSPRDVADAIIRYLFVGQGNGRVPVVVIAGTNGKTTTTRLLAHILACAGRTVGIATSDGIWVGGELVSTGDFATARGAQLVLSHPKVEVAVLEVACTSMVAQALGFDRCDVAAVINVAHDHLGFEGIETLDGLADVKALPLRSLHPDGAAVLNADEPSVLGMARRCRAPAFLFSRQSQSQEMQLHLKAGGKAVVAEAGKLLYACGSARHLVCRISDIVCTWGGLLAHQVENAMAATACAIALGIPFAFIRHGLATFRNDHQSNPGRFSILCTGSGNVVLDRCRNPAALQAVLSAARRLADGCLIGVVAGPRDQTVPLLLAMGSVAGRMLDHVIVSQPRGNPNHNWARVVARAALQEADRGACEVLEGDEAAIRHALQIAKPGDWIVVLHDEYYRAREIVARWVGRAGNGHHRVSRF